MEEEIILKENFKIENAIFSSFCVMKIDDNVFNYDRLVSIVYKDSSVIMTFISMGISYKIKFKSRERDFGEKFKNFIFNTK